MGYINTKILEQKNLNLTQVALLQILHQNRTEDMSELLESYNDDLDVLKDRGFIDEVKAKNKQESVFKLLRLSKTGKSVLDTVETPEVSEDDLKIFNWVAGIYANTGREIGNAKRTKMFISQFSKESGISKNSLAFLIQTFINDESQFDWSRKLQNLFFKGESVFSVRFDLHSSRLYQYYLKNENYFLEKFKQWEE